MPAPEQRPPRRPRPRPTFAGLVVTIDGPAGAGKTTVARGVARALRLEHLDTGAMYRAVTAKALAEGIAPEDERGLVALIKRTAIAFGPGGLEIDGRPVGREIRSRPVNRSVSAVSAHARVRRELVRLQREMLTRGGVVAEGRDIGTVVYPKAPVKVFLTASIGVRAGRRHRELSGPDERVSLSALRREIARRDALDSMRAVSPLVPAEDARIIDSTRRTPAQVIKEIVAMAEAAAPATRKRR